jgi:hypothetical protein
MENDTARWSILSARLTMRFVVVGRVDAAGSKLGSQATRKAKILERAATQELIR